MRPLLIVVLSLSLGVFLAAREPCNTSRASGSPEFAKPCSTERVFPQLQFEQLVELLPLGKTGRMVLVEVGGVPNQGRDTSSRNESRSVTFSAA